LRTIEKQCLEDALKDIKLYKGPGPLPGAKFFWTPHEYTLEELKAILDHHNAKTPVEKFVGMQFTKGSSPYRIFRLFRKVDDKYRSIEEFDSPPDSGHY